MIQDPSFNHEQLRSPEHAKHVRYWEVSQALRNLYAQLPEAPIHEEYRTPRVSAAVASIVDRPMVTGPEAPMDTVGVLPSADIALQNAHDAFAPQRAEQSVRQPELV